MKIFFMYLLHTIEVAFYSEQVIDPHQSKLTPQSKYTEQINSPEQNKPHAYSLPRATSPQSKSPEQINSPEQLLPRASPQSKISRTHIPSPEQLRPRASPQSKGKVLTLGKKERKKNYCQIQFFYQSHKLLSAFLLSAFLICG
jgi:hypothetical protein